MNQTTNYIKQRLSLRQPLTEALEVVEKITDVISLEKTSDDTRDADYDEDNENSRLALAWEMLAGMAGYCSSENYDKWFKN